MWLPETWITPDGAIFCVFLLSFKTIPHPLQLFRRMLQNCFDVKLQKLTVDHKTSPEVQHADEQMTEILILGIKRRSSKIKSKRGPKTLKPKQPNVIQPSLWCDYLYLECSLSRDRSECPVCKIPMSSLGYNKSINIDILYPENANQCTDYILHQ